MMRITQIISLINDNFSLLNCKAIVLANEDGLPIYSKIQDNATPLDKAEIKKAEYIISALSSTILTNGLNFGKRISLGEPRHILLHFEFGSALIYKMPEMIALGVVFDKKTNPSPSFEITTRFVNKIMPAMEAFLAE